MWHFLVHRFEWRCAQGPFAVHTHRSDPRSASCPAHPDHMHAEITAFMARAGGAVHIDELTRHVPLRSVRRAVSRGELVRVMPRVYAAVGSELALTAAGVAQFTGGALSHVSALATWGLSAAEPSLIHITIPVERHLSAATGVVIHRARPMPRIVQRDGTPVVHLERSLVDAWAFPPTDDRRAPVIDAVRRRLTTPDRVRAAVLERPNCRGAQALLALLSLLELGCHSELEIWGMEHVLAVPGLPPARHQILVAQDGRRAYIDAGWEDVLLGIEFDGAASHFSSAQRENDLRRDAWLASLGWLIQRFSYRRVTGNTEGVRHEIRSAYEIRRHQLLGG